MPIPTLTFDVLLYTLLPLVVHLSPTLVSRLVISPDISLIFDNIVPISNFPKRFEVGVRKTETIFYEVLHDTQEEAIAEVQKKVNERDWDTLLAFPPGSPDYSPIPPFTDYKIKDVTVKEQVLRPNPQSEGGSSDT